MTGSNSNSSNSPHSLLLRLEHINLKQNSNKYSSKPFNKPTNTKEIKRKHQGQEKASIKSKASKTRSLYIRPRGHNIYNIVQPKTETKPVQSAVAQSSPSYPQLKCWLMSAVLVAIAAAVGRCLAVGTGTFWKTRVPGIRVSSGGGSASPLRTAMLCRTAQATTIEHAVWTCRILMIQSASIVKHFSWAARLKSNQSFYCKAYRPKFT
jgi:hypothetical protein